MERRSGAVSIKYDEWTCVFRESLSAPRDLSSLVGYSILYNNVFDNVVSENGTRTNRVLTHEN